MELNTQNGNTALAKKKTIKVSSIIMGALMIAIPVIVALLVTKPELLQMLVTSKSDIIKGIIIGVSILPVFLFVGIKGGDTWYKKWWAWLAIIVTCGVLVALMLMAEPSIGGMNGMDMGPMNMGKDMYIGY